MVLRLFVDVDVLTPLLDRLPVVRDRSTILLVSLIGRVLLDVGLPVPWHDRAPQQLLLASGPGFRIPSSLPVLISWWNGRRLGHPVSLFGNFIKRCFTKTTRATAESSRALELGTIYRSARSPSNSGRVRRA
jgi:hypothetical protein